MLPDTPSRRRMKMFFARVMTVATLCIPFLLAAAGLKAAENVPHEVGGFVLGSDLKDYPEVVESSYLRETVVTDLYGFRKGYISVGVCKHVDKILRIRMKYEDTSKKFFKELLEEYKKHFGPPDEWKGDSFGILHIWKWYFTDTQGRQVSLLLQHNLRNTNETIGNTVKLSYPDLIEEERLCFNEMCEEHKSDMDHQRLEKMKMPDWHYMIPR